MQTCLFKADKNTYKANLHCHTTVSDGALTPEQVKEAYKSKGYSIVAFSDHRAMIPHPGLNDENFLALNACEVDFAQNLPGESWEKAKTYHLNLLATGPEMTRTPPLPAMEYGDTDALNEYVKARTDEGFLVNYNHPYWSLQDFRDYGGLKGCFAVEIYNHGCEADGLYGYNPEVYDEMLRAGSRLFCLSTDDNHNGRWHGGPMDDSFGGFVVINAESLKYETIIGALKRGDFYASQGPEIYEISIKAATNAMANAAEKNKVYVRCSPAAIIALCTDGRRRVLKRGAGICEAEFELAGDEKYIRVLCRDKDGKDANSNAYWL
ncbi:MAG: PHP domain-containing protein [Defluviitaleaceae bacterium]|nr:PHP domain-containing protein [Defluviitaleaceae bacterium]